MNVVSDTASHFNYGKMCKSYTSVWELFHLPHSAKITETVVSCFCSVLLAFFIGKSANALFTNEEKIHHPLRNSGNDEFRISGVDSSWQGRMLERKKNQ